MTEHTVTMDSKGRLVIPQQVRDRLGLTAGTTIFVQIEENETVFRCAKAINPFDALADHAEAEYRAGRTRNFRDIAQERGIKLDVD